MRILIGLILVLLLGLNSLGQPLESSLEIHHLTGDFYIYITYQEINGNKLPSNSMYLVTDSIVVLFDTPCDTTQFQPLLDSVSARHNKNVALCISTHYHDDRTAGLEFFKQKGIKTYTSLQTYYLCEKYNEKQAEFYFTKDTVFTIDNYEFETYYPGKGHTEDNIVIWFENDKVLYGGCLIKSTEKKGIGNITDVYPDEWEHTIENLIKKYPKTDFVIPGHFGWKSSKGLEHTLQILKEYNKNNNR